MKVENSMNKKLIFFLCKKCDCYKTQDNFYVTCRRECIDCIKKERKKYKKERKTVEKKRPYNKKLFKPSLPVLKPVKSNNARIFEAMKRKKEEKEKQLFLDDIIYRRAERQKYLRFEK